MNTSTYEQRMYSLVMYNISPIQAGIQASHAMMEYAFQFRNDTDFQEWGMHWKTVVLLNGGVSNSGKETYYERELTKGTMELSREFLDSIGWKYACFYEPDLNYSLSAISFLLDERVFNRKKYPDPDVSKYEWVQLLSCNTIDEKLSFHFSSESDNDALHAFIEQIGGQKNFLLRTRLSQFSKATN